MLEEVGGQLDTLTVHVIQSSKKGPGPNVRVRSVRAELSGSKTSEAEMSTIV